MTIFASIGETIKELLKQAFGVNLTEFLINIIATIILVLIVRFFFWNKVTSFLDKKKEKIRDEYKDASSIKENAEAKMVEANNALSQSKKYAALIVDKARKEADAESAKIVSDAKVKAQSIVDDGREEAEKQKSYAVHEAKAEIVDVASKIASKMINDNIDQDKYNEEALNELGSK